MTACVIHYLLVSHGTGPDVSWNYIGLAAELHGPSGLDDMISPDQ